MCQFSLTYDSVIESEARMLDDLDLIIEETSIDAKTSGKFRLAISEAFTNALIHGNRRIPAKKIKIAIEVNDFGIAADIFDEGHDGLKQISERVRPGPLAESGRGVGLIEHCTETVRFWENDKGGLVVSVTFSRPIKNVTKCVE